MSDVSQPSQPTKADSVADKVSSLPRSVKPFLFKLDESKQSDKQSKNWKISTNDPKHVETCVEIASILNGCNFLYGRNDTVQFPKSMRMTGRQLLLKAIKADPKNGRAYLELGLLMDKEEHIMSNDGAFWKKKDFIYKAYELGYIDKSSFYIHMRFKD